jgi:uncharacterized protein
MKLRNVGLVAVVLAAVAACDRGGRTGAAVTQGGSADPWANPQPRTDPIARPLFWAIDKDGTTSYVLGTMHGGVDAHAKLPQLVWDKLAAAKTYAMEIDPTDTRGLDFTRKDGTTLRDELGDVYWKKLEDAVGVDAAKRLLPMKAMVPGTMLIVRGLPSTPSMDSVLHTRARQLNKKLVYLETLAHELAILERWIDARVVKDTLDDLAGTDARIQDMLAAYLGGDEVRMLAIQDTERELWKQRGRSEQEFDAQMEDVLYKRNASWMEPIEKLHADGGGFIAMGALHAVGPRGVLELLEQRGYKITRLTP